MRFELQRKQLLRYQRWTNILGWNFLLVTLLLTMCFIFVMEEAASATFVMTIAGFVAVGILLTIFLIWYTARFVQALDYRVEDHILHVEEGVFTYQRKAIPLDRVTDLRLVQNIVMRWLGIWKIQVQTAGIGQMDAEGTLWAVEAPKEMRNQLLAARGEAVKAQRVEAAA